MGIFNSKNNESNEIINTSNICNKQSYLKVSLLDSENKIIVKINELNPTTTETKIVPSNVLCNNEYFVKLDQMLDKIKNINGDLIDGHIYNKIHEKTIENTKELITKIYKINPIFQPSVNATIYDEIEFNYENKITGDIKYDTIYIYDEKSNIKEFNDMDKSIDYILFLINDKK